MTTACGLGLICCLLMWGIMVDAVGQNPYLAVQGLDLTGWRLDRCREEIVRRRLRRLRFLRSATDASSLRSKITSTALWRATSRSPLPLWACTFSASFVRPFPSKGFPSCCQV